MPDQLFDELARTIARGASPRAVLKAFAASAAGAALALVGGGPALLSRVAVARGTRVRATRIAAETWCA